MARLVQHQDVVEFVNARVLPRIGWSGRHDDALAGPCALRELVCAAHDAFPGGFGVEPLPLECSLGRVVIKVRYSQLHRTRVLSRAVDDGHAPLVACHAPGQPQVG